MSEHLEAHDASRSGSIVQPCKVAILRATYQRFPPNPAKEHEMRSLSKALALAAFTAAVVAMPAAQAAEEAINADKFVKMCDTDKDGMVSKAEVMKMVDKMFDKHDTKKMGKLDKKQAEAFLMELMKGGG